VVVSSPVVADGLDRPEAYIAGDRRRALAEGRSLPARVSGAAIFADISGFTPFTEALAHELGSQRASEVLTGHLLRWVVDQVVRLRDERPGGIVLTVNGKHLGRPGAYGQPVTLNFGPSHPLPNTATG